MGRKIRSKQKINNEDEVLLSALSYNDVGQLQEKSLHNGMQKIGYSYNERGWMKSMTAGTAMFDQYLRYNDPQQGGVAQWNGNISEQAYTSTHTGSRWFTYGYDKLNRLKTSAYSNANELGEELSYDQMGNISRLIRGGTGNGTLDYAYTGNRLMSLSGFKTGSYVYDDNGNMTTDGVRNVTIGYNALKLPVSVTGTGGNTSTATYQYDADGNKQRSVQGTMTRDYIAGIQYENGQISQVMTEEGRAVRNALNNTYRYEYFLKDHLGNTRVTIDDQGGNVARVVQSDEYYAFGLNRSRYVSGDKNNYLYNGKEKQDVLTEQYDYGARFYDPVIARWTTVDPSAENDESYSPYNYTFNNPVRFTDPDGRWPDLPSLHTALDVAGLVPGLGEIADGVNAAIYVAEGNYGDAALSMAAMVPLAGTAATAVKLAKTADKAITVAKAADKGAALAKAEARAAKLSQVQRPGKDFTKAGKEAVKDLSRAKNDGKTICVTCKTETIPGTKDKKGVKPPGNRTEIDHSKRKREGGSGTPDNGAVNCRDCNQKKH